MSATLLRLTQVDALDRATTYTAMIKSLKDNTTEKGYIHRNTVAVQNKASLRSEWAMFMAIVNALIPFVDDTFESIKIDKKAMRVLFSNKNGTEFEVVFDTKDNAKNIQVHTRIESDSKQASSALAFSTSLVDETVKDAKKRKCIPE